MTTKKEMKLTISKLEKQIESDAKRFKSHLDFASNTVISVRKQYEALCHSFHNLQTEVEGNANDLLEAIVDPQGLEYEDAFNIEMASRPPRVTMHT